MPRNCDRRLRRSDRSSRITLLSIGNISLDSPLVQAALSGYSDLPMRRIARRHGAAYALNEVVLDKLVVQPGKAQRAVLDGYRLVFNVLGGFPRRAGIANLKQNPKGKVEGVLMQINNSAEGLIQKKEGIPGRAKRIEVSVTGDQDKKYEGVSVYVTAQPDGKTHLPARGYVDLMLQAAKDFEFSEDYTKKLQNIKTAD